MQNSAYLVRLPDRTPLPVTSMAVETDADSWAWALSATLAGPDAWGLIRPVTPGFLPWEVEAGINGHVWRFVLDAPSLRRVFGQTVVSIRGRSLSAWLADPYTGATQGTAADPRTANQLAEEALDMTGWTLDWGLVDWLVPGGVLSYDGTPISRLAQIVGAVDGCLYSHPWDRVLYAYPRYPSVAWEWDELTADVAVPESALITWDQEPDHRPLFNAVYVSGTLAGVLAHVVATGTAGDLLAPMVTDPLISDTEAIAARARGVSVLSGCGPGSTIQADTLLTLASGDGPGLLRPGLLVALAGVKGRVRSTRISAAWSGTLTVRQSASLERREVEA